MKNNSLRVAIIGKGDFGSAVASLLDYNSMPYEFVTRDTKPIHKIDVVFIAVPTQSIRQAITRNTTSFHRDTIFVNCSKGIEEKTRLLPFEILDEIQKPIHYASLIGPSFASEIIDKNPTLVSLGYSDLESSIAVRELVETPYFNAYETGSYKMLELSGALKNVYAILCGYAYGIGFGRNTNVRIILSAQRELERLARALNYTTHDLYAPGIIGDIVLTCGSSQSRNYTYGYNLAKCSNSDPHESNKTTVEGYHTCRSINDIARENNVLLPLAALTTRIVSGDCISMDDFRLSLAETA